MQAQAFLDIAVRQIEHSYKSGPFMRCLDELRWPNKDKPLQLFTMLSNNAVYCPTLNREDGGILRMVWGNELFSLMVWLDSSDKLTYALVKGTKADIAKAQEIDFKEATTLVEYWATFVNQGEPKQHAYRTPPQRRVH